MNDAFVYDDIDRRIWEEELSPRLPARIYDAHSHTWLAQEHRSSEGADPAIPSVVEEYPLPALRRVHQTLFPGRSVGGLIFGCGDRHTDFPAQGRRIAREAQEVGYQSLTFAPPSWDEEVLERQVESGHIGFKPYWYLAGDTLDSVELHRVCAAAPNAHFILAHLGRSYLPEAARFDAIRGIPNLWADCSMVQDWEVIARAFSVLPVDRILFGLDLPVAQEKGKLISVNGQRHFFTARPHPWSVHVEPGGYEVRCTLFAYEIVRALLKGADAAGLTQPQVNAIFWDNSQELLRLVREAQGG
jgi:hypothetical protein